MIILCTTALTLRHSDCNYNHLLRWHPQMPMSQQKKFLV
nr:MAG TPA: hypothetical protein [Caudoviricetes sp.]